MRDAVMVVEDDVEMGGLLERGLLGDGYDVALFSNGVDALNAARDADYAAAVLDVAAASQVVQPHGRAPACASPQRVGRLSVAV